MSVSFRNRSAGRFDWQASLSRRSSKSTFVLAQLALVAAVLIAPWVYARVQPKLPTTPALRPEPRRIVAEYDEPTIVTDEQLAMVLEKLRPRLRKSQPKINYVDHALRFWGVGAKFDDPDCLSGEELRTLLTDQRAFAKAWGEKTRPLLDVRPTGVAVRVQQGNATSSHVDHTVASLAETGTPLNFPIHTAAGATTYEAMVRQALLDFEMNQAEYEWTSLALALLAVDGRPWYTAEGDRIDFNRIADRLMRQQYIQGVCMGNHRLFSLTILLRVDDETQILTPTTRERVLEHLAGATQRLVSSQAAEGYWDQNWYNGAAPVEPGKLESPTARRVLATGHALEWWAMAPRDLHPPREVLVRAGQWLAREIERMDDANVEKNYTFLSHAGRSLALWRGQTPPLTLAARTPSAPAAKLPAPRSANRFETWEPRGRLWR